MIIGRHVTIYYLEDSFNVKFENWGSLIDSLSFLYQNVKSLPKHLPTKHLFIDIDFSFSDFSETWFYEFMEAFTILPTKHAFTDIDFSFSGLSESWWDECMEAFHDIAIKHVFTDIGRIGGEGVPQ